MFYFIDEWTFKENVAHKGRVFMKREYYVDSRREAITELLEEGKQVF